MNLDPLGVIFLAKDMASGTIRGLSHEFSQLDQVIQKTVTNFGQATATMGAGLAAIGVGAVILAPLALGAANAIKYQAALVRVGNVANVTGIELTQLGDDVRRLAGQMDFAPTEVLHGMKELASAGFSARESLELVDKALLFQRASAGELNMDTAAATLVAAMRGYGFEVSQASKVTDMLTAATNASSIKFDELALMLGNTAADANLANQSFQGTLALLGSLRDTGLTSMRSAEKVRMALQTMISDKAMASAKAMGVSLRDQNLQLRSVVDIVADMQPRLARMNQIQKEHAIQAIFGADAMSVYNAVAKATYTTTENGAETIHRGVDAVRQMTKAIDESAGSTEQQYERFKQTFAGAYEAFKGNISLLLTNVGLPFLQLLSGMMIGVQKFTKSLAVFSTEHPKIMKMVAAFIAIAGAFVSMVGAVVFIKGAFMSMSALLTILGVKLFALGVAFGYATLIVGGLVAAFYLLKKAWDTNFGGFADFFKDTFNKIKSFVGAIVDLISNGEISSEVYDMLQETGMLPYVEAAMRAFTKLKHFLGGIADGLVLGFSIAEPFVLGMWEAFRDAISQVGGMILQVIKGIDAMTGGMGEQTKTLTGVAMAGKIMGTVIGGALGLAVTLFVRLITISTRLIGGFMDLIQTITTGMALLAFFFLQPIDAISLVIKDLTVILKTVTGGLAEVMSVLVRGISSFLMSAIVQPLIAAKRVLGEFIDFGKSVIEGFSFSDMSDKLAESLGPIVNFMANAFGKAGEAIKSAWLDIGTFIGSIINGIAQAASGFFDTVIGKVSTIKSVIGESFLGKMFGVETKAPEASFAEGGKVLPFTQKVNAVPASGPMLQAPTLNTQNAAAAVQAGVIATQNTTAAVKDEKGADQQPIVIHSNLILDGKVAARAVNQVNEKRRLAAGGQQ